MKQLKLVGILIAAIGLVGLALVLAPSAYGQGRERADRSLMMLAGRGAQIGVRIADGPTDGVVIEEVQPDSPAEKAGLKPSDVIVEFGGEHVRSARQFGRLVQETPPGRAAPESSRRTSGVKQRSANASAERRGLRLDHLRRRGGKDDGEMRSEDGGERLDEL